MCSSDLLIHARFQPNDAFNFLIWLEDPKNRQEVASLFHKTVSWKIVKDLRTMATTFGFSLPRSKGWRDIYHLEARANNKIKKAEAHLNQRKEMYTAEISKLQDKINFISSLSEPGSKLSSRAAVRVLDPPRASRKRPADSSQRTTTMVQTTTTVTTTQETRTVIFREEDPRDQDEIGRAHV